MLWTRLVLWMNLGVIGFSILVLAVSDFWTSFPYCLNMIAAGISMFALIGLLGSEHPFDPQVIPLIAWLGGIANSGTLAIGIGILVGVDLPDSLRVAAVLISIAILNLAYIVGQVEKIRSGGSQAPIDERDEDDHAA